MYSKRKGVVTRKEENHYYIRYYGKSIANTSGIDAKLGVDLAINENKDLSVGDFVKHSTTRETVYLKTMVGVLLVKK